MTTLRQLLSAGLALLAVTIFSDCTKEGDGQSMGENNFGRREYPAENSTVDLSQSKDTVLYRSSFLNSKIKLLEHLINNTDSSAAVLVEMNLLYRTVKDNYPNDGYVKAWARDSLKTIKSMIDAIDLAHEYDSLNNRLEILGEEYADQNERSEQYYLSGYVQEVWRTNDFSETYLVTLNGYTNPPDQCLLVLTDSRFTSSGNFNSLRVMKTSYESVKVEGGFTKNLPVYQALSESVLNKIKQLKQEIDRTKQSKKVIARKLGYSPTIENIVNRFSPRPKLLATILNGSEIELTWPNHFSFVEDEIPALRKKF